MLIGKLPADYRPPRTLLHWRCGWGHIHVTAGGSMPGDRFSLSLHLGPVWYGTGSGDTSEDLQVGRLIVRWCILNGAFWHRRPWRRLHVQWVAGRGDDERIIDVFELVPKGPAFMHGCRCRKHREESDRLRRLDWLAELDEAELLQ